MLQTIKILAIDKEEIILKSIKKALKGDNFFDFIISTCGTALDGLKLIRSDTFDLVFIDLVLPGMTGAELIRRIKNIYPNMPVIIMSGFSSVNSNIKRNSIYENLDAAGFLIKPFTTEELRSLVNKTIEKNKKIKDNNAK